MEWLAIVGGVAIAGLAILDLVNTLVTTTASQGRWWLSRQLYGRMWGLVRRIGRHLSDPVKERLYGLFAPLSVIGLLIAWAALQVLGFGLIWWGLGGVDGGESLGGSLYYSGVVYFTLGFGEIVPAEAVPRVGALVEAFSGVLTTALVIGYLPALYSAYSQREQKLVTLDDGSEQRIAPTNLVMARCPTGDIRDLDGFFAEWEAWISQVMETHTTFRMLVLFRSQNPGQHWLTALGVVLDAALHAEMVAGSPGRPSYWCLRRGIRLFQLLAPGPEAIEAMQAELIVRRGDDSAAELRYFVPLYEAMANHGFELLAYEEALARTQELRAMFDAPMELMIDALDAPRGFWGHAIGHRLESPHFLSPE